MTPRLNLCNGDLAADIRLTRSFKLSIVVIAPEGSLVESFARSLEPDGLTDARRETARR